GTRDLSSASQVVRPTRHFGAPAPALLSQMNCLVRSLNEPVGRLTDVRGGGRDPDAQPGSRDAILHALVGASLPEQPANGFSFGRRSAGQENSKLVTPISRTPVTCALRDGGNRLAESFQQRVASSIAVGIIVHTEKINIDHQHGSRQPRAPATP